VGVGGRRGGNTSPPNQQVVDTQAIIEEVIKAFLRRLAVLGSALLQDVITFGELSDQVRSILDEVLGIPEPEDASPPQAISQAAPVPDPLLSVEVGTSRARSGIHPVESIQAAGELFDVALPIIARYHSLTGREILDVSQRLHQAIMNRIALASLPYVEFLLAKVHATGEKERQRISRDLHDRVGHAMALALQHFDMHRYFSDVDSARANQEFTAGLTSLDDALRTVRQLSSELRRSVGEDGIKAAVESYLRDVVTSGVQTSVSITGDAKVLPPTISEELYLIMREACHNALIHGQPSELRVALTVTEAEFVGTVADNGLGFIVGTPGNSAGGGMPSMAERVELLNGTLTVDSAVGEGTTVNVRVPLNSAGAP
jgi:signal transduction histidine kinase